MANAERNGKTLPALCGLSAKSQPGDTSQHLADIYRRAAVREKCFRPKLQDAVFEAVISLEEFDIAAGIFICKRNVRSLSYMPLFS